VGKPNRLLKNFMIRHSEERSDEESLFLLAIIQEGFLASLQRKASVRALGMMALGAFSATW
jgi:hypothetical protein